MLWWAVAYFDTLILTCMFILDFCEVKIKIDKIETRHWYVCVAKTRRLKLILKWVYFYRSNSFLNFMLNEINSAYKMHKILYIYTSNKVIQLYPSNKIDYFKINSAYEMHQLTIFKTWLFKFGQKKTWLFKVIIFFQINFVII